jgi:hypothetical protein
LVKWEGREGEIFFFFFEQGGRRKGKEGCCCGTTNYITLITNWLLRWQAHVAEEASTAASSRGR